MVFSLKWNKNIHCKSNSKKIEIIPLFEKNVYSKSVKRQQKGINRHHNSTFFSNLKQTSIKNDTSLKQKKEIT